MLFYDKRARSCKFDVGDKVLLLLSSESNKVLLQWNGPYEVLEVVNVINYKINVKGVVNTYPANMLKLYVVRQNVTPYRSAVNDAHCNVKESKKISNNQELIQSHPISCPQNQKGNI